MIIATIATYNEAASIGRLVRSLHAHADAVIVADGGSTDGTRDAAVEACGLVLTGQTGIRRCLIAAWRTALRLGATRIVQIDAGGSHDPDDLPALLAVDADLVVGSRFVPGAAYAGRPWRAAMSIAAAAACNYAQAGAGWRDWTSGYRVLSASLARYLVDLPYRSEMHGWQIEVLARAGEAGMRIVEVPIRYTAGRSSFSAAIAWEGFMAWNEVLHHIGWVGSRLYEEMPS